MADINDGTGHRHMSTGMDAIGEESCDVSITFIANNLRIILPSLTLTDGSVPTMLYDHRSDVILCLGDLDKMKKGPSASACAALALLVAATKCKLVRKELAVTGTLDLRGRVGVVGGLAGKIEGALVDGVELLVVPQLSLEGASITPELQQYTDKAVKRVNTFVEVLQLTTQGEEWWQSGDLWWW